MDWKDFFLNSFSKVSDAFSFTVFYWDGKTDKTAMYFKKDLAQFGEFFLLNGFFVSQTGGHGTPKVFMPYNQIQKIEFNLE